MDDALLFDRFVGYDSHGRQKFTGILKGPIGGTGYR
jgi:hypothetical protein